MSVTPAAQDTPARPPQQPSGPRSPSPPAPGFAQVLARIRCPKHGLATPPVPRKHDARPPTTPARAGAKGHEADEPGRPGSPHQGRADARELGRDTEDGARRDPCEPDLLDPSFRQAAHLAPPQAIAPVTAAAAPDAVEVPKARMSLEELMPALVRRIAWSGDRHKGTVRLEIGAGAYEGTTLVVHADGGRVRVEVSGKHADALRPRLDERLRCSGLDVDSVT